MSNETKETPTAGHVEEGAGNARTSTTESSGRLAAFFRPAWGGIAAAVGAGIGTVVAVNTASGVGWHVIGGAVGALAGAGAYGLYRLLRA